MDTLLYWIWLSEAKGIGIATAKALLLHFGSPENIYKGKTYEYGNIEGVNKTAVAALGNKSLENADKILQSCKKIACSILTIEDIEYPARLKNIYDPPLLLYVHGNMPKIDDEPVVSIVGSRTCTNYGLKIAEKTGYELAKSGFIVATGLAKGIDSAAAKGTLRAGGSVIGVIGSGLDVVYPPENRELFVKVAKTGAVVSEYPPGTKALAHNFPARNRIISGLSLGVAVIEAPKRSGALITASRALEQNRDVFTLPANVDAKSSEGSNALLREGAIPFITTDDIINEYADLFPDKININTTEDVANTINDSELEGQYAIFEEDSEFGYANERDITTGIRKGIDNLSEVEYIDIDAIANQLDGNEKTIALAIGNEILHVDLVITRSKLLASEVLTALLMMEISGFVKRENGSYYRLKNSSDSFDNSR
ncbi:MAG: DNA-processing protein DprA [Oscillospiraceae bacterium]|nr:DNA-processing protein DprA [Oscillospiraceae bacterium]